ncbi:MAG: hypothetical protein HYR55_15860 [Acidobacteria bacterium]|nr:hypothetical protein [Acidobacteriota bacterium]MBI3656805.1 hypothetical protein [Acidobacteriota bacterium]
MKKYTSTLTSSALVFLILTIPVLSQSLARVAKQERARQSRALAKAHIYTNMDLEQFKIPIATETTEADKGDKTDKTNMPDLADKGDKPAAVPAVSGDSSKPAGTKESTPAIDKKTEAAGAPVRDATYWRKQSADARARVQSLENKGDVLQLRLSDLNNKFQREQDIGTREGYQTEIQKTLAEVDDTRSKLEAARRDLEDLERLARRENVPPGWLR